MHPFAVQTWKERSQQSHFKKFVLTRASVDAAVTSEDKAAYFLLVDTFGGYLPKLNFPVQERRAISSAAPCHKIASTEIENLREQIAQLQKTTTSLRERNSELQSQLDKKRQHEKPPGRRRFCTAEYHRVNNKLHHTLRWYFGLTNEFRSMTNFVTALFCDYTDDDNEDGLEEQHSSDVQREALTAFEQCLLAKSYVRAVCCGQTNGIV